MNNIKKKDNLVHIKKSLMFEKILKKKKKKKIKKLSLLTF